MDYVCCLGIDFLSWILDRKAPSVTNIPGCGVGRLVGHRSVFKSRGANNQIRLGLIGLPRSCMTGSDIFILVHDSHSVRDLWNLADQVLKWLADALGSFFSPESMRFSDQSQNYLLLAVDTTPSSGDGTTLVALRSSVSRKSDNGLLLHAARVSHDSCSTILQAGSMGAVVPRLKAFLVTRDTRLVEGVESFLLLLMIPPVRA
ncbi:hypothetical protein ACRALDRAFT_206152 [Sodiomyces alcalophilus JCM 7366]|uniref:uncharacterized protein n=1 Tax=Sodiomyces alcalophilus JCM 7366 TaxID=591952 RepID=UPI0039B50963